MKSNRFAANRRRFALSALTLGLACSGQAQTSQNYPDTTAEVAVPGNPFPHIDIASVDVTVDATETNITFKITLDGDPVATNWGNYMIGIRSGGSGTATGNGWGRPINLASGMTHWVGCWVSTGGDGQIWSYSGTWNQTGSLNGTDGTVTVDAAGKFVEITTAVANLGLDPGEVFQFDVYTSGGGGGDSAVDSLSASGSSVTNWGDTFTTNLVAGAPNPALEFTMPGVALDNDGDGLFNSVESDGGPGSFVDENDTGTDPDNPDTDGDFLEDGYEVTNNPTLGTDPTLADSDADGVNDATEISLTGVADDPSTPSGGATEIIGFDFFDYVDGGIDGNSGFETRVFDFDNNVVNDTFIGHTGAVAPWSTTFGTQVICGKLLTDGGNATRQFNGAFTGGSALGVVENTVNTDSKDVYVKVDLSRLSGSTFSGVSFMNGGTEVAFAGVRDALNGPDRNFGVEVSGEVGAAFTGDIPVDRVPNTIVARLDTSGTPRIMIWVDPDLTSAEPTADAEASFVTAANAVATGIRLASGGRAYWDNLVVATNWEDLDAESPTDDDTDNLRDSWEELYAPGNLATLNSGVSSDADLLLNEQEQDAGTDPLNPDTDGDNLDDDVETNTGLFVSASDTGTDPCDTDTDDDTLQDDVETGTDIDNGELDTGSDPNVADSDNDGENDGFEIFQGTDPNDGAESSFLLGLVKIDGEKDDSYGSAVAVQTVNTQFGDNASELNAAYAQVQDGKLYLMLTGNIEDNFNKLEIFIDSDDSTGITDYVSAGNDGTDALEGMFFDVGFEPDYHLIIRRGNDNGNDKFDVDFVDLNAGTFNESLDILSFGTTGFGKTDTDLVNALPIRVGYNNSNTAGVVGGIDAAVEADALAVNTGLELCIDLTDLNATGTELKVMAVVASSDHSFLSNQVLAGLPTNLDDPGPGTSNLGDPTAVFFDTDIPGDQFFVVGLTTPGSPFSIDSVTLINSGTQLEIEVKGLTDGADYVLTESTDLTGFGAVTTTVTPSASFTASGTTQTLVVDVPVSGNKRFYRVEDAPGS